MTGLCRIWNGKPLLAKSDKADCRQETPRELPGSGRRPPETEAPVCMGTGDFRSPVFAASDMRHAAFLSFFHGGEDKPALEPARLIGDNERLRLVGFNEF